MASKVIILGLMCLVLAAVVQSAPQYAPGEEPTYDESSEDEGDAPAAGGATPEDNDEDYQSVIAGLSEHFDNAADPGRRLAAGGAQHDSSASDE